MFLPWLRFLCAPEGDPPGGDDAAAKKKKADEEAAAAAKKKAEEDEADGRTRKALLDEQAKHAADISRIKKHLGLDVADDLLDEDEDEEDDVPDPVKKGEEAKGGGLLDEIESAAGELVDGLFGDDDDDEEEKPEPKKRKKTA